MIDGVDAFQDRFNVSRETLERLETYHQLLLHWNPRINLVSRGSASQIWQRHFHDSAQLLALAPEGAEAWADLGSGGGFPGLVIAIMANESRPHLRLSLVESDQRKATFLRAVIREAGLSSEVLCSRIEAVDPLAADVISARALAPLPTLLPLVQRHLAPGGRALFQKGGQYRGELAEALETWRFDCEEYPSETDPEAVILAIGGIERV